MTFMSDTDSQSTRDHYIDNALVVALLALYVAMVSIQHIQAQPDQPETTTPREGEDYEK